MKKISAIRKYSLSDNYTAYTDLHTASFIKKHDYEPGELS